MAARTLAIVTAIFSVFATSHIARADTRVFPDFSGYTAADVQEYTFAIPNPGRQTIVEAYFLTPDGEITCEFIRPAAQCNYPPTPAADPNGVNWIATDVGLAQSRGSIAPGNKAHGHSIKRLAPQHTLTVGGVVCGVLDIGSTACEDPQGRGFWLRRNGLPQIDVPPTWSVFTCSGSNCTSQSPP
jgi:hypothetical protein